VVVKEGGGRVAKHRGHLKALEIGMSSPWLRRLGIKQHISSGTRHIITADHPLWLSPVDDLKQELRSVGAEKPSWVRLEVRYYEDPKLKHRNEEKSVETGRVAPSVQLLRIGRNEHYPQTELARRGL